jgi:hypothetical protein
MAVRAQSAYSNAVISLNPAAYWPMHEVEAAAQGDIETNYGSLGLLGTGYYPDWTAVNQGGIQRQAPGALANDPDPCVFFTKEYISGGGAAPIYTNSLMVPHTSPLSTLTPPFTVECWCKPTNTTAGQGIWGQFGFEGLNAGNADLGTGHYDGIYFDYNGSFILDGEDNGVQAAITSSSGLSVNAWYYLVVVCDAGTNFTFYTNGVATSATSKPGVGKYSPDYWTPMTIGNSRGYSRAFVGYVDEFAVYTNIIGDITTHYTDGISGATGAYFHDVTNDNPLIYLRMDSFPYTVPAAGTWPVLYNDGMTNGVAVGNGVYTPGTMPGIVTNLMVNPNGVSFGGVTNIFAQLSGVSSFADAGYADAYNPTGSNANFAVTAIFRGNPCDNRIQSIVGHGTNSWQMSITTNGCIVFNAGNGNKAAGGTGQAAGDIRTTGVYNDGNWHQLVAVNSTNVISIYVDGALDTNGTPSGVAATNIIPGNAGDVMIGSDPTYTNSPIGVGRQFAGQICDVAFYTNALTFSQVQTLFSNCEEAPFIVTQPISASVNAGAAFTNIAVVAHGSGALSYQWYTNGVAFGGQTSAALTLNPAVPADASTNDYVVVANSYGSVTSAVVTLTVNTVPVVGSQFPVTYTNLFALYAGANPSFSVNISSGAQPLSYNWYTNGVLDAVATTNILQMTNVQIGTFSNYCIVTNIAGSATSVVWTASVIADPADSTGLAPYPQAVLALNPIGYWRMNDTNLDGVDFGSSTGGNGDFGWVCHDYAGGNDGIYTNSQLGFPGYNPVSDPADSSAQFGEIDDLGSDFGDSLAFGIAGINFEAPSGVNAAFTVEAWVSGYIQNYDAGIVTLGNGGGEQFDLDCGSDAAPTSHGFRFFFRDASGNTHIVVSSIVPSSLPSQRGPWYHLVGVVDEVSSKTVTFYINGASVGSASLTSGIGVLASTNLMGIGSRTSSATTNYNDQFLGNINDVAVYNYALSASQVASQYAQSGEPPYFPQPPTNSVTINAGGTLVIPATALGTPSITNWWSDVSGGSNLVTAVTNGIFMNTGLTVSNVPGAWNNDQLELSVSNAFGGTNVFVALTVLTNAPVITANLPPQVLLVSGGSYTYSIGAAGAGPFGYQWYNVTTPVAGQTNATYTVTAGSPGSSTTYYVVVTNVFGAVTSSVSVVTSIAPLTTPYASALLRFNPVGYWPMHEVEAAAPGDIETNYGSLGLLGTGFYADWTPQNQGGILRGIPGALAGDSDQAVDFTDTIIVSAGGSAEWTNALYIPHTSPLSTLNPPFTVECWCYPFNTTGGQDVWAQFGFEGLNAGSAGLGGGNYDGIQLIYNGGFYIAGEYNGVQTTLPGSGSVPINNWYHLVLTCDAKTNITLYTDGVPAATTAAVGVYSPDYWTPLTLGNGRGPTRAMTCYLDEFSVYTNVLTSDDIVQHYSDGTNTAPVSSYYHDVTNDNPVIYLRMDAPAVYSPPSAGTWPTLTNYAGASGVYTPGTMPGIMPGPSNDTGGPLKSLSGTNVALLNGVSSYADAGYALAFNPVGPTPFSVTAMFRGNPCDGRVQDIVGHSDNSWRIMMNTNGTLQCAFGTNGNNVANSAGIYNDGYWHQVVDVYEPASNPNVTGTNVLYVDGVQDAAATGASTNGIGPGSASDVIIGSDPEYTNSPAGVGHQFAGQVCEVALFANALTAAQVQSLYQAAVSSSVNTTPANIVFSVANNMLTLSWPADHKGWHLQAQTNSLSEGIRANWVDVTGSDATNLLVFPINPANGTVFYRLTYP